MDPSFSQARFRRPCATHPSSMALQADTNWHGESGRALLNPLVEDRNGWFGVRLLHVLEQARAAEDLAAEGAMLRVYVAYRGSAIVTFLLGSFFT